MATPASTTAAGIAKRFTEAHLGGVEAAIGAVNTTMVSLVGQVRRSTLLKVATIDGDTTDVEVYGRTKEQAVYNHGGARNLRPHIGFWAEAGVPLAAELMGGADDPRSNCVEMLDRSIAALPDGVAQVRCRWDAGYFAGQLAHACIERGVQFAIGVKRARPVIAAAQQVGEDQWTPAIGMHDTEIAVIEYLPGSWPAQGVVCIARRTRIPAEQIPTERARKRRTIPKDQLALALEGRLDHVYGYSFILTNLDVGSDENLAEVEWWYHHRTDIEALNKDAKLGAALRHLPSADHAVNSVWMWAALLACAISSWIQEITGIDRGNGRGRRTGHRDPATTGTGQRPGPAHPPRRDHRPAPATRTTAPGRRPAPPAATSPPRLNTRPPVPARRKTIRGAVGTPVHPARQPGTSTSPTPESPTTPRSNPRTGGVTRPTRGSGSDLARRLLRCLQPGSTTTRPVPARCGCFRTGSVIMVGPSSRPAVTSGRCWTSTRPRCGTGSSGRRSTPVRGPG